MVRLDSVKIIAPIDCITEANINLFRQQKTEKGAKRDLILDKAVAKGGDDYQKVGLNQVTIDHLKGELQIDVSAKILKDQYHELININTLDRLMDEVNNSGVIGIDKGKFADKSGVHLCDTTVNIPQFKDYDLQKSNKILKLASVGSGYTVQTPQRSHTLIYRKGSNWITIYDKPKDLMRDKIFRSELGKDYSKVFMDHVNEYRMEQKLKNYKQMRDCFQINTKGTPQLVEILNSNSKPLYKAFEKITYRTKQMDLFLHNYNSDQSFNENINFMGWERFIILNEWNEQNIEHSLKYIIEKEGRNARTFYRRNAKAISVLQWMRKKELEGEKSAKQHELVIHIKEYLKVA